MYVVAVKIYYPELIMYIGKISRYIRYLGLMVIQHDTISESAIPVCFMNA